MCTLQTNVVRLKIVGISVIHSTRHRLRLSCKNRAVELDVGRSLDQANISGELVPRFDLDDIAWNDICSVEVDEITIANNMTLLREHVLDGRHGA